MIICDNSPLRRKDNPAANIAGFEKMIGATMESVVQGRVKACSAERYRSAADMWCVAASEVKIADRRLGLAGSRLSELRENTSRRVCAAMSEVKVEDCEGGG